jgi:two-component system, sensor histidine kinase and response regulator
LINRVDDSITVLGDPVAMRIIIRNLVSNAIKFTRAGSVTVFSSAGEKTCSICVLDTGQGMSAEIAGRVFQWGVRNSNNSDSNGQHGHGLGLLICKEMAEKINGKLTFETSLGKGTQFCLELPRAF